MTFSGDAVGLLLQNANAMTWGSVLRVCFVDAPVECTSEFRLEMEKYRLPYLLAVKEQDLFQIFESAQNTVVTVDQDGFVSALSGGGLALLTCWLDVEAKLPRIHLRFFLEKVRPGGHFLICGKNTEDAIACVSQNIADLTACGAVALTGSKNIAYQLGITEWEGKIVEGGVGKRVANLPISYGPRDRARDYLCVSKSHESYPSGQAYNCKSNDELVYLAAYQARFEIGIRSFDDLIYHSKTGCSFESNGNAIHDTTWHVMFQTREVEPYYSGTETEWRLWQRNEPIIKQKIEFPVFLATVKYSDNFFHWFNDVVPRIWLYILCRRFALIGHDTKLLLPQIPNVGFQRDFLEALPIAASDLVYLDEGFWRLSRAVVPRMRTDESGRFSPHFRGFRLTATPADFFTWISESVEHIVDPTINSSSCVYISRSDTTKRIIKNENELIRFLENKGFSVLRTGGLSLSQQVSLVRNAKIIIGPHGAGLTNLAFARHLRALVEIRNEQNADIGYRFMCQYRNARYFTYLSTSVSYENCDVKDYDMHVDMGVFRKFYDDVLANMISASN